ncbi:LysR family transcriptional regulator [Pseudescherichia vulneris]|uniref:LysR family transcriptional regulator n=1 Tax=Pseudescherichia vulneris TaxID=566 RepID=UPI00227B8672|nr:LysR family transcriptional regulator [Pseudescherichia vulneris]WAH51790.1 LysR family transcriptional regulator [Pseudescherichia vulneris]
MAREGFGDLVALIAIAQTGSFTRAAAQLGVTQPALSVSIRGLEERLGVRLLLRSTRSVTLTMAGQHLVDRLVPEFAQIDNEINSLNDLRDKPTGTLRITAIDYAIRSVLWPRLSPFLKQYPDITIELVSEYASVDIAARGYDAGVRFGMELAQDMISVRIGPDVKNIVVGSADYFAQHAVPQTPDELSQHRCIRLRTSTYGGLYDWEFTDGQRTFDVRINGPVICNNAYDIFEAAKEGFGLAYLPLDMVQPWLDSGQLVSVLQAWCPVWPGFHLYYPNRRQHSRAMTLLVDALRYQEKQT